MCECHLQYQIRASATEGSGKKAQNAKKNHSEDFPTLDELLMTNRNRHQRRALSPPYILCFFALVVVFATWYCLAYVNSKYHYSLLIGSEQSYYLV